jgi:hypothetical protein
MVCCNVEGNKPEFEKKELYPNGITKSFVIYDTINNIKRHIQFHENGKIKSDVPFRDKLKEGRAAYYTEQGILKSERTYKHDTLDGASIFYYPNGQLRKVGTYTNGKVVSFVVYNDKQDIINSMPFVTIRTISDTIKKGETYFAKIFLNALEDYEDGEIQIAFNEDDVAKMDTVIYSGNMASISIVGERLGENKYVGSAAFIKWSKSNKDSVGYSYVVDFEKTFFVK